MSAATIPATLKTECLICHGVQQNQPINLRSERTVSDFLERLLKHIGMKHSAELMRGKEMLAQYQTYLILSTFASDDPSVQAVLEGIRADVFQRCRKHTPTDDDLEIIASRCEFSTDKDRAAGLAAMKALRDLCCEVGPHAPKLP